MTEETLDGQTPLKVAHCNTFNPVDKQVAELVANVGLAMLILPDNTDHEPVPSATGLAFKFTVGDEIQID